MIVCIVYFMLYCTIFLVVCSSIKPKFTWLVTYRHDTTRSTCRVETSVLSLAVRQARFSKNAWARYVERVVSCRDVTSQVTFGLYRTRIFVAY